MEDGELARALGHVASVLSLDPERFRFECTCRYDMQTTYALHSVAIQAAIFHITKSASAFRTECAMAGLTLEEGLAAWNGRERNRANGELRPKAETPGRLTLDPGSRTV